MELEKFNIFANKNKIIFTILIFFNILSTLLADTVVSWDYKTRKLAWV